MFGLKGMGDMMKLLGNRDELMGKMEESKARARNRTVVGESGAGMVKVTANGVGEIVTVNCDPEALKEPESLGPLIAAAANIAITKSKQIMLEETQSVMGIELPPGAI